jgi:hypothetical protein
LLSKFKKAVVLYISFRPHANLDPIDGRGSVAYHSTPSNVEVKEIGKWRKNVLYTELPRNASGGTYILSHLHAAGMWTTKEVVRPCLKQVLYSVNMTQRSDRLI